MKTVADYHNVISEFPEFFTLFLGELVIVSGTALSRRPVLEMMLKATKVPYHRLFTYPGEWTDNTGKLKSKLWKIKKIIEEKPDLLIDDDLTTLLAVKKKLPETKCLLWVTDDYKVEKTEKDEKISY